MIELVAQMVSTTTACCKIVQPLRNRLISSMLAVEANRRMVLVRIFCNISFCISNGSFIPLAFLCFLSTSVFPQKRKHHLILFVLKH